MERVAAVAGSGLNLAEQTPPDYTVFPNPSSGNITIRPENRDPVRELTICDLTGSIVFEQLQDPESYTSINIAVGHLPAGIYFIIMNGSDHPVVQKIIKE